MKQKIKRSFFFRKMKYKKLNKNLKIEIHEKENEI